MRESSARGPSSQQSAATPRICTSLLQRTAVTKACDSSLARLTWKPKPISSRHRSSTRSAPLTNVPVASSRALRSASRWPQSSRARAAPSRDDKRRGPPIGGSVTAIRPPTSRFAATTATESRSRPCSTGSRRSSTGPSLWAKDEGLFRTLAHANGAGIMDSCPTPRPRS